MEVLVATLDRQGLTLGLMLHLFLQQVKLVVRMEGEEEAPQPKEEQQQEALVGLQDIPQALARWPVQAELGVMVLAVGIVVVVVVAQEDLTAMELLVVQATHQIFLLVALVGVEPMEVLLALTLVYLV